MRPVQHASPPFLSLTSGSIPSLLSPGTPSPQSRRSVSSSRLQVSPPSQPPPKHQGPSKYKPMKAALIQHIKSNGKQEWEKEWKEGGPTEIKLRRMTHQRNIRSGPKLCGKKRSDDPSPTQNRPLCTAPIPTPLQSQRIIILRMWLR